MIHFSLCCVEGHDFDGWFRNNDDFESQKSRGLVACPVCHSTSVEKGLMAPAIAKKADNAPMALSADAGQRKMMAQLKELSQKVRANSDYVGNKFAEEARKIHFGESDKTSIYGEATAQEATQLAEDGVSFMPLPTFPDEHN